MLFDRQKQIGGRGILMPARSALGCCASDLGNPYIASIVRRILTCHGSGRESRGLCRRAPRRGKLLLVVLARHQGIGFFDQVPRTRLSASSVGEQLIKKGLSFKGYSQSLPAIGSEVDVTPPGCSYPFVCENLRQRLSLSCMTHSSTGAALYLVTVAPFFKFGISFDAATTVTYLFFTVKPPFCFGSNSVAAFERFSFPIESVCLSALSNIST